MRDAENNLIVESTIGLQVSILQGAHDGDAVYVETHQVISNQNGLITYIIGNGDVVEGVFEDIDWGAGPYWLETKADPTGGTAYSISGVTQFLSVPYALHSKTAEKFKTTPPKAIATEATNNGEFSATINGIINGEGFSTTVVFEWGTSTAYGNTVTATPSPVTGSDDIAVHANLSGLQAATTYHYRIRATNAVDVVYSDDMMFTTDASVFYSLYLEADPENAGVVTGAGEYQAGAEVSITATANEGWEFVEWSGDIDYIDDPTSANTIVTMPADDVTLTAHFQEAGDPEPGTVTDIDGNVYQTVIIGDQEWMAENLRVTKYNNGDAIPTGLSNADWSSATSGAYAIYHHISIDGLNSDAEVVEAYGKLYNWYAVDDSRGLCPTGWSVSGDADWTMLVDYLIAEFEYHNDWGDDINSVGNALKSCRQVGSPLDDCNTSQHPRWNSHSTHYGFDEFGFIALPAGFRGDNGNFGNIGGAGLWWTANDHSETDAWERGMYSNFGNVGRFRSYKSFGFSVRCLRDID